MNRRSSPPLLCILLISLTPFVTTGAKGDGNVGCLFQDVCIERIEWCYNDGAFGRCVQLVPVDDDLYKYKLNYNDLEKFKALLRNLLANGYGWKNSYAQCLIQAQLYAIRLGTEFSEKTCSHLMVQHYEDPIRQLKEYERLHPEGPAGLRGTNKFGSNDGYSEKYDSSDKWPNYSQSDKSRYRTLDERKQDGMENDLPSQLVALPLSKENTQYKMRKKSPDFETRARYRGTPLYMPKHRLLSEKNDDIADKNAQQDAFYYDDTNTMESKNQNRQNSYKLNSLIRKMNNLFKPTTYTEGGPLYLDNQDNNRNFDNNLYDRLLDDYDSDSDIWGFRRSERLDVKKPGPYFKVNNYAFQNMNKEIPQDDENIDSMKKLANQHQSGNNNNENEFIEGVYRKAGKGAIAFKNPEYAYVPGTSNKVSSSLSSGFSYVYVKTKNGVSNKSAADILNAISSELHIPREVFTDARLNGNALLFKVVPNTFGVSAYGVKRGIDDIKHVLKETLNIHVIFTDTGNKPNFSLYETNKNNNNSSSSDGIDNDDSDIDKLENRPRLIFDTTNIVYVMQLDKKLPNIESAEYILRRVEDLLNVDPETFILLNINGNELTFWLTINPILTDGNLLKSIESIEDDLRKENINVQSVYTLNTIGVGAIDTKKEVEEVRSAALQNPKSMLNVLMISLCMLLGAAVVSLVAFCFVRRNNHTRDKLKKTATNDTEHSKVYQLCRARMAGKPPELSHVGHRITSISRESDNSPSSRSSTSSWGEEPLVNLDISTAHLVLDYLQDHIQNPGRIDAEWDALCTYEAEPCSVSIAQSPENIGKNRYVNALPYDHARVVLNALSNVSGSDYINASPIIDYEPRNPLYIATQGPLPNTTIDFWQMVWEQGCVVIVMLTRLVENDVTLCHRYWPQEGSELYNIYEVHLVSEHIWCDDYLVRSFYLKNVKTTETRTVTQFHFLTWPEGGIPTNIKAIHEFRRKVNKSFRGRSCPIVVHCSDGVGRTGTYVLMDLVLNRILKGTREINIAGTLEHIRDQRVAVSTKEQFEFVLESISVEVDAVLSAFPPDTIESTYAAASSMFASAASTSVRGEAGPSRAISRTVIEEEPSGSAASGEQTKDEDPGTADQPK